MTHGREVAVRWTIGPASARGFEALRLSVWGAWRIFGPRAAYAICVNGVPVQEAKRRTGRLPPGVVWHQSARSEIPRFLRDHLDPALAQGVAWKFAPPRMFPERCEIALDNDCILWAMPDSIASWLAAPGASFLIAADVRPCFGQFAAFCSPEPRNSGIRGLPPGFDLAAALQGILARRPVTLTSELDEQGLQVAALAAAGPLFTVSLDEVTICSPFHPHLPHLGQCGAHFVGLNVEDIPWTYFDRPAIACLIEHWERHRPALYAAVGIEANSRAQWVLEGLSAPDRPAPRPPR